MAKREKTSQAVILAARFNPIHERDRDFLAIYAELVQREKRPGVTFTFKDIVMDAVLLAGGRQPEMYNDDNTVTLKDVVLHLDTLFGEFTEQLLQRIASGEINPTDEMMRRQDNMPFSAPTQNFLTSFRNRHGEES